LLAAAGSPSAVKNRHVYSSPPNRLATRSGSTAAIRPSMEKPGSRRKEMVWGAFMGWVIRR
jgi:hypothetical protein